MRQQTSIHKSRAKIFLPSLLIFLFLSPNAFATPSQQINYYEAVQIALSCNPGIHASASKIESAQAAFIEARGAGLPKLSVGINAERSNNPLNVFGYKLAQGNASFADFGAEEYTGPSSINTVPRGLNSPGYYSNINSGFKIKVPIYTGGNTSAKLKNTSALIYEAQHGNMAARTQLAYHVLQAYEGVLSSQKLIGIAKENVQEAETYLKMTQSLFKQSIVIESDLLFAQNYLRTVKTSVISAQAEWQNHLDEFRSLIGRPDSKLTPKEHIIFPQSKTNLSYLLNKVIAENAYLNALKSRIQANRANIDAANSSNRPQVNLQMHHNWNGYTIGRGLPSNTIALGVDWLVFSSGEQTGTVRQAEAVLKQSALQFDDAVNSVRLSLIKAIRAEQLANIEYETHTKNATQAKEVVHKLTSRYGRGLVPLGQVIESQIQLKEAQNRRIISQYNKALARGQILLLTNELARPLEK